MRINGDVDLWQHQQQMADFVRDHEYSLILAGCSTGKTLAMFKAMATVKARKSLVLTIHPALWSVWYEEAAAKTDTTVLVLDKGTSKEKWEQLKQAYRSNTLLTVAVNYETARLLDLNKLHWDIIIADESHRLKAHNSKQSQHLALVQADRKVAMTGTAWDDRPTDLFGQVRFLQPRWHGNHLGSALLGSWSSFFEQYVVYRMSENIKIPVGYKNLTELKRKIEPFFLFIDRDKVLKLQKVQHVRRYVALSRRHQEAYEELKKEMLLELDDGTLTVDNRLVLNLRLHQIAGGYYQPDDRDDLLDIKDGDAKLEELRGIAEELGSEPFVVFARFKEDVARIRTAFTEMGITTSEISGREDNHRAWRAGNTQSLIANIQAGSAGIDLTRAAYGVFYSTGYSNTDYTQAIFRLDRSNQTRPVTLFHIIARNTVDEDIDAILSEKKRTARKLL